MCHLRTCPRGEWQSNLVFVRFYFFAELRSRTGDCEAILVKKLFNTQHVLHVTPPVHPLPGAALHRFQLWEFGLPESKHIRRQTAKTRNFAYPEIELFWNQYFGFPTAFFFGLIRGCLGMACVSRKTVALAFLARCAVCYNLKLWNRPLEGHLRLVFPH